MKKYLYLIASLALIIVIAVAFSCSKENVNYEPSPEVEMMSITMSSLKPDIDITTLKNGSVVPEDQDTLYVMFRRSSRSETPDYLFKLSPIPYSYTFELPIYRQGYDIFMCTYPDKLMKLNETWDMPKHLWYFNAHDVRACTADNPLNVELKKLSGNLIIRGKEGTTMPDNVQSVTVWLDAVFNNYHPKYGVSFGLYERKVVSLWPKDDNNFYFENTCMGMNDIESLGTFVLIVCREGTYCNYFTYRHQLLIDKNKKTIIDINLNSLGVDDWNDDFIWVHEEDSIVIPVD